MPQTLCAGAGMNQGQRLRAQHRARPLDRLSQADTAMRLYLQETFTFRVLTGEASVVHAPSDPPFA
ncbi:hypothetical protein ACPOL_0896 [Acidisarcina polymorpha]|uniref:Uncharacterized protein n=1 Tax=Acidisarcina polymorpha TaxID=2211140 RepID=A0A2Z5FTV5_9BACT|nr:hypothetical protein [Acidisarcina polymorpha]AXC10253.1 hypothetical protein ACPOL_0896 [Acidisarcina polymorpha]